MPDRAARPPRPAARARRLPGPAPDTTLSRRLVAVCACGERAVTVIVGGPGGAVHAALGSPADPEAFTVWRSQGVYVFLSGEMPERLDLDLGPAARVTATPVY